MFENSYGEVLVVLTMDLVPVSIDFKRGRPVEMPLHLPPLESLEPGRFNTFEPTPLRYGENEFQYENDFRVVFNREGVYILFSADLDKIRSYWVDGRIACYTNFSGFGHPVILKVGDLTDEEYLAIRRKSRGEIAQ